MARPVFPFYATLLWDGFTERPEPNAIRTEMESGPAKQAPKASKATTTRPVKYRLNSAADYQSFKDWHRDDLKHGTGWFDWTDPVDGVTKLARIPGGQIDPKPARRMLDVWDVSFQIETWG